MVARLDAADGTVYSPLSSSTPCTSAHRRRHRGQKPTPRRRQRSSHLRTLFSNRTTPPRPLQLYCEAGGAAPLLLSSSCAASFARLPIEISWSPVTVHAPPGHGSGISILNSQRRLNGELKLMAGQPHAEERGCGLLPATCRGRGVERVVVQVAYSTQAIDGRRQNG